MLELEEALAKVLAKVPPPHGEPVSLWEAHGRFPLETVVSPTDLPLFDNSAMDGYAVRAVDIRRASKEAPVSLRLIGRIAAGERFGNELSAGQCIRLFTGSLLPAGADCVVMQEDTQPDPQDAGCILVTDEAKPWENVRFKGEDIRAGSVLATGGDALTAGHLCSLAATGMGRVIVGRRPVVGLLATGSELRETGQALLPGQIYESNRIGLSALIRTAGAIPVVFPIVPDVQSATEQALAKAFRECDAVVSAGGASVGDLDFIRPSFENLGGELGFWKVAMRPGRPFAFGLFGSKLFFGLPGNPISALVTFLMLVRPALRRWQGAADPELPRVSGILSEEVSNPGSRRHLMRVKMDGEGMVALAGAQGSHLLNSFVAARGLLDVPAQSILKTGSRVSIRVWEG